jgi:predicted transposase YbfD/YdcC
MAKPKKHNLNLTNGQIKLLFKKLGISDITEIDTSILKNLKEQLKKLTDLRQHGKTKYKIWDIVICALIANFTNIYDWEDIRDFVELKYDWLRKFLLMTGGIPSAITYERIFSIIDSRELETILNAFLFSMIHCNDNNLDIVNIDGRVDCGSSRAQTDYKDKLRPLNVLNAYSNKYGICLASEQIDEKTNEIPTIPIILNRFNCKDIIITWDALNTQKENVKCVINNGGDYVVPVKANQGNFLNDLELYFKDLKLEQIEAGNTHADYLKEIEKSHSSTIIYEYYQTSDVNWYFEKEKWENLTTIGMVKKTIIKNNETKIEKRYYISSLNVNVSLFSKAIRNHWSVENKLHWHLDFTFREDKNTTANKQALMNLQLVNKFCLAILTRVKPFYNNISLRRIRNMTSYNFEEEFVNILCYLAYC